MKVHLVTLTWNAVDKLFKLKNSLLPCLNDLNWSWIIKSNGCKDNTVEVASKWHGNIKILSYPDNKQNFSEGINYCVNITNPQDEDYILLLNNDVIFNDSSSIKNMIAEMEKNPDIGVVGARLLYTDTDRLQHAGVVFNGQYRAPFHFKAGHKTDVNAGKNRWFQCVTGAVLLTKFKYFKQVCTTNKSNINGLDEKLIWSFDDIDLCLSIKYNMNKKILYCGKTNIFHEESASLKKNPVNKMFMHHNLDYMREKWMTTIMFDQQLYENDPNFNLAE